MITIIEFQDSENYEPIIIEGSTKEDIMSLACELESVGQLIESITNYKFNKKWQDLEKEEVLEDLSREKKVLDTEEEKEEV